MNAVINNTKLAEWNQGFADVDFTDNYKLRLTSKKLSSGKCQVKFFASAVGSKDMYGYVLVDAEVTLKEVVIIIKQKLVSIQKSSDFHHIHLYSIGKHELDTFNFIVFDC